MKVGQSLKLENSVHGELGVLSPRTPGMARYMVQQSGRCAGDSILGTVLCFYLWGEARIGSLMIMVQRPGAAEDLDIYSLLYTIYTNIYTIYCRSPAAQRSGDTEAESPWSPQCVHPCLQLEVRCGDANCASMMLTVPV